MKHGWEKIANWECLFVHSEEGLFLSVHVDDIKLVGKKHNIDPMWKVLNNEVDLVRTNIFLGLGLHSKNMCNEQRHCGQLQRIFAVGLEKLPFFQNLHISSWSYDMAGHAKKLFHR